MESYPIKLTYCGDAQENVYIGRLESFDETQWVIDGFRMDTEGFQYGPFTLPKKDISRVCEQVMGYLAFIGEFHFLDPEKSKNYFTKGTKDSGQLAFIRNLLIGQWHKTGKNQLSEAKYLGRSWDPFCIIEATDQDIIAGVRRFPEEDN